MGVDGPSRTIAEQVGSDISVEDGEPSSYLAGSHALDSLERLITSTETYFHPSNAGMWTLCLTTFLHRVCVEFCKRWKEEEEDSCKTPVVSFSYPSRGIQPLNLSPDTSPHTHHPPSIRPPSPNSRSPRHVLQRSHVNVLCSRSLTYPSLT